jgi:hypothetical protein
MRREEEMSFQTKLTKEQLENSLSIIYNSYSLLVKGKELYGSKIKAANNLKSYILRTYKVEYSIGYCYRLWTEFCLKKKNLRCNFYFVPKPGNEPKKDPQCILEYGHKEEHQFV